MAPLDSQSYFVSMLSYKTVGLITKVKYEFSQTLNVFVTPQKFNIDTKNGLFQQESPFPNYDFGYPCEFSGV